uniref:Uncharacterized protein n=1 Tax=Daucus carota subsp. sativus TaxID=79200 RepID=A0A161ZQD7_DAUCS
MNQGTQVEEKSEHVHKKGEGRLLFTKKSSDNSSVKKVELNHHYDPCGCKSSCGGEDCLCFLNRTYCEKYCGGCRCAKNQCRTRQCSCVAANRECDPDVCLNCFVSCGDGTCGAPPPKETSYNCMNMKLFQNQHQKVLIGESCVSGWGAFLMNECEKDAFIGEYTGELITHYEADKRGKTYDRLNSSYLFDLDDQYVIDAYGMGSNLRFANHSPRPNCYVKNLLVAGDHRIGIFAKERIYAGQELFIDYGYKADVAPSWANDHKVSSSNEDYSHRSSRAKKRIGAKEKISDSDKDEDYTPRSTRAKKGTRAKRKVSDSDKDEDYTPSSNRGEGIASFVKKPSQKEGLGIEESYQRQIPLPKIEDFIPTFTFLRDFIDFITL